MKRPTLLLVLGGLAALAALSVSTARTATTPSSTTASSTAAPAIVNEVSEKEAIKALRTPPVGPVSLLIDTGNQQTLLARGADGTFALSFQSAVPDAPLRGMELRRIDKTLYARGLNSKVAAGKWVNLTTYLARTAKPSPDFVNAGGVFDFITWAGPTLARQFAEALDPVQGFTMIPASTCATADNLSPSRTAGAWDLRCSEEFPPLVVKFDAKRRVELVIAGPTTATFEYGEVSVEAPPAGSVLSTRELKALGY